jgi:diketogulonate reductase-like aldo/keto reductase
MKAKGEAIVRTTRLASGDVLPILGQGTWHFGETAGRRKDEIAALHTGFDLGMSLVDTAEMYGDGSAEELVSEAIAGRRDEVFLVSKVLPQNASRSGTIAACERSLSRLHTDRLDLYLLHWKSSYSLEETIEGFQSLLQVGKIRRWGVSNFDVSDMEELVGLPDGSDVATNQVLYNLTRRGIEYDLLPWCHQRHMPVMAYSPIEQGRMLGHPELQKVAERHSATAAQVALAWILRDKEVIAIPRAGDPSHVRENRGAVDLRLSETDMEDLDRAFPPPRRKVQLEML